MISLISIDERYQGHLFSFLCFCVFQSSFLPIRNGIVCWLLLKTTLPFSISHLKVNVGLLLSSFYVSNCSLKELKRTYQCTCSLAAFLVPRIGFWPVSTTKNDILDRHTTSEGNWLLFPFLQSVGEVSCIVTWNIFFICGLGFRWAFCKLHVYWNVWDWVPEMIESRMCWFCCFFVGRWLFLSLPFLHGLITARVVSLCFTFWLPNFLSTFSFCGILICFLIVPVVFSHRKVQSQLMRFINTI